LIELKDIRLRRSGQLLMEGLSLTLPDPAVYLVHGTGGSGKSSLLSLLAGRLRPQGGQVLIDGQELYRAFGGYGQPIFSAELEENLALPETASEYLENAFAQCACPLRLAEPAWAILLEHLPGCRQRLMASLSHGERLLVVCAIAGALPLRLIVLDGILDVLEGQYRICALRLLRLATDRADAFVVLSSLHEEPSLPFPVQGLRLSRGEGRPMRLEEYRYQ
jgi:ABC-type cobalamin/Fe3+-siderophores transport system ATPase subunit